MRFNLAWQPPHFKLQLDFGRTRMTAMIDPRDPKRTLADALTVLALASADKILEVVGGFLYNRLQPGIPRHPSIPRSTSDGSKKSQGPAHPHGDHS